MGRNLPLTHLFPYHKNFQIHKQLHVKNEQKMNPFITVRGHQDRNKLTADDGRTFRIFGSFCVRDGFFMLQKRDEKYYNLIRYCYSNKQ